jgi:hypothetical protein
VRQRQEFIRTWLIDAMGGLTAKTPLNARITGGFQTRRVSGGAPGFREHAEVLRDANITSLRYFIGLLEEVGQTATPETYWQHVRSKADQLERQWLERHACPGSAIG